MNIDIEQKIRNLILEYRKKAESLTQEEKEESGFIRFESPIQVELIHIERKKYNIDFQILVFTTFSDIDDLDIIIHSPLKFRDQNIYLQKLEEITHSDKWVKRKFPNKIKVNKEQPDELPYSIIYENIIADAKNLFFTFLYDFLLTNQYKLPHIIPGASNYKNVFYWVIFGNIKNLNIEEHVKNEVTRYNRNKLQQKELQKIIETPQFQKQIEEQNMHEVYGYGTFIYPPKWIGEFPELKIEDKLTNQTLHSFIKDPLITQYKGCFLFIEKDGYIAIGEPNEDKAIELLNEIMGTMNFSNQGAYAVRRSEVGNATINTKFNIISSKATPNVCKPQILEKERSRIYRSFPKILRNQISKDQMEKVIKLAEKISFDKNFKNYLILYSEAISFFDEKEYTLSFLMSWFIFEKMLKAKCEELRNNPNLDELTKEFLVNNYWDPNIMIQALFIAQIINYDEFDFYMALKNQRNCIIHENGISNYEESDKIRRLCFEKIKNMIDIEMD